MWSCVLLLCAAVAKESRAPSNFPVVFVDSALEKRLRKDPGLLKMRNAAEASSGARDAVDDDSSGLLRFSDIHSNPELLGSKTSLVQESERVQHVWDEPCTIQRFPSDERPKTVAHFLKNYASTPLIIPSQSAILPQLQKIDSSAIKRTQLVDLVPCLCAPVWGTNFVDTPSDDLLATGPYRNSKRMCLWKYGMLLPFVLNGTLSGEPLGTVTNPTIAQQLKFQCRLGSNGGGGKVVQELAWSLLQHNKDFWESLGPPVDSSVWLSTPHTRTPLHSDPYLQFLAQLHGTKHVTVYESSGLHAATVNVTDRLRANDRAQALALGHGGVLNVTGAVSPTAAGGMAVQIDAAAHVAETCIESGSCAQGVLEASVGLGVDMERATLQRCLLRQGEMLWLPPDYLHDLYGLEPSVSVSLRWPSGRVAAAGGKMLSERTARDGKDEKRKKKMESKTKVKKQQAGHGINIGKSSAVSAG